MEEFKQAEEDSDEGLGEFGPVIASYLVLKLKKPNVDLML